MCTVLFSAILCTAGAWSLRAWSTRLDGTSLLWPELRRESRRSEFFGSVFSLLSPFQLQSAATAHFLLPAGHDSLHYCALAVNYGC